jgi:hypothetical protein
MHQRVRKANKFKIPLVSEKLILDSLKAGKMLDAAPYLLQAIGGDEGEEDGGRGSDEGGNDDQEVGKYKGRKGERNGTAGDGAKGGRAGVEDKAKVGGGKMEGAGAGAPGQGSRRKGNDEEEHEEAGRGSKRGGGRGQEGGARRPSSNAGAGVGVSQVSDSNRLKDKEELSKGGGVIHGRVRRQRGVGSRCMELRPGLGVPPGMIGLYVLMMRARRTKLKRLGGLRCLLRM